MQISKEIGWVNSASEFNEKSFEKEKKIRKILYFFKSNKVYEGRNPKRSTL